MTKQNVHILLESTTYLFLKAKDINISGLTNELLKSYVELEDKQLPEEQELMTKLENISKTIKEQEKELQKTTIMLTKVRSDAKIAEERRREKGHAEAQFLQRALRDL